MRYTRPREHLFIYLTIIVQDLKKCNSKLGKKVSKTHLYSLMERDQPKQMQFFIRPGKGKFAFLCKLCHINAVCGHTADLLLRECTGLSLNLLAGIAQRAAAVAKAETIHSRRSSDLCLKQQPVCLLKISLND